MSALNKISARFLTILVLLHWNGASSGEFTYITYWCNDGIKSDCSDCDKTKVQTQLKYLIDLNKRYILITQKNFKNQIESFELEGCRIYSIDNWVCKYPRKSNDAYGEDMLYQVTEGFLKFEFKSSMGVARICGVKQN